jgi:hypothetical protein
MHGRCWLSIAGLILLPTGVSNGASPFDRVPDILNNLKQFDGKTVTIRGTAAEVKLKISRKGNPYSTLRVKDDGAEIAVFQFGHPNPPLDNGDCVEVTGRFLQENHVPPYTFYNEIVASTMTKLTSSVTPAQCRPSARSLTPAQ